MNKQLPKNLHFEISELPINANGLNCNCNEELDIFGIKDEFEQDTFKVYSLKDRKTLFLECQKCGLVQQLVNKIPLKKITKKMK